MRPLLFLLFLPFALVAQSTVESVPNQKLINGSYVSNPDRILDEGTVSQIDTLLASLEKRTTVQVAVVALESIGSADIFEFAQNLFVTWGIGNKTNDNGLLLLLVKDQRTIRFHTGYGLEGVLPDVICKRIQRDFMVPEFKNGNYGAGILAGLQEVSNIVSDPNYAQEVNASETGTTSNPKSDWEVFLGFFIIFYLPIIGIVYWIKAANAKFADSKKPGDVPYPKMRLTRSTWLIMYIGIPLLVVCLFRFYDVENPFGLGILFFYVYLMFTLFHRLWRMRNVIKQFMKKQEYYEIVEFIRSSQYYWLAMAFFFPFPFFFYFFYHLARKRIYRNHSRSCKACQGAMSKLNDTDEDEYLSKAQLMEETLKAVDYDVWKCQSCQATEAWFYLNRFSKYDPCPKCKTIAYKKISDRTITSATYSSSGKGETVHQCKFCGYNKKSTYSIARLTSSSSSGSGSSFSSGSSSSGGSWGGGSSGGGGASSSW